jgi:uncharacterized repeat protein (TIGR01451 family)
MDDLGGDFGSVAGGWTLSFQGTPSTCASCTNADLSLTNTPGAATVNAGSNITYTYLATNNGPDPASNLAITTTVPAGTTFVSATAPGSTVLLTPAVGGTGSVSGAWAGNTANGGTQTMTMVVAVPPATAGGTIVGNSATVSSATADSTPANNTATSNVTVVNLMPTITSFSPGSGSSGSLVNIFGVNFTGVTAVKFNGANAFFSIVSPTQMNAIVPATATTGYITATNPYGTGTSPTVFTIISGAPRIWAFSPTSGPTGTVVTINGVNFTGTTSVKFNGVAASSFTVIGPNQVQATVPAAATTGPITVTTPAGTATTGAVKFTKL